MSLRIINVNKDRTKVLDRVISDIYIETNENLYSNNALYAFMKNAGYIEDASVKITAEPILTKLIDGSSMSRGFNVTGTISSMQFYSLFEFEKFNGVLCTLNLDGVKLYLKNVIVNLKLDAEISQGSKAPIILSFTKTVQSLRDVLDPNPWPQVGQVDPPAPWVPNESTHIASEETVDYSTPPDKDTLLEGTPLGYFNGNRVITTAVTMAVVNTHDLILVNSEVSVTLTMPVASTMVGKQVRVIQQTDAGVDIKTSTGADILSLVNIGSDVTLVATATAWVITAEVGNS